MRRRSGFSRLELMLVLVVLGIVTTVLLSRLTDYQEAAEKASMESTTSTIKNALRSRMAILMVQGRVQEYILLAQDNPMDWLDEKPANYAGEFANPAAMQIPVGNWYFDSASKTLVYLVKNGNNFKPDSTGKKRVRYKVAVIRNRPDSVSSAEPVQTTDTVALTLVEPYEWR